MAQIPLVATYRLQLTPTFGLDEAADVVPYLAGLGISHVYTSPFLQAAPGSRHGYDVVDPTSVNAELGGEAALQRFFDALRRHGLANVIDLVPNHMSVGGPANRLWWDVLMLGEASEHAVWFDIDWGPSAEQDGGKIVLPILQSDYDAELKAGTITVRVEPSFNNGAPVVCYFDHRFPVDPRCDELARALADGHPDPADLHHLLEQQHYRLAPWQTERDRINYRRFFEVDDLAGIRAENDVVFEAVHRRALQWASDGSVQGFRIDHIDGLRDPAHYLARLRDAAPDAWIVVEKILASHETLPNWPVDGTTGYDFAQALTAVFVDPHSGQAMTEIYHRWSDTEFRSSPEYATVLTRCKRLVTHELFAPEVRRAADAAGHMLTECPSNIVPTRSDLTVAIEAIVVAMPVYRTYVDRHGADPTDLAIIDTTIKAAKLAEPNIDPAVFDLLADLWGAEFWGAGVECPGNDDFAVRLQQLSTSIMAKGAEDTAFYRYGRLLALNDVGSDPAQFGLTVDEFHSRLGGAAHAGQRSMLGTSTHDSKRSEDVRARIALLSEIPDEWGRIAAGWQQHNTPAWGSRPPDRALEYSIYQTLVGAFPLSVERAETWVTKAMREAKGATSWIEPNVDYESSVVEFMHRILDDETFQKMLRTFVDGLLEAGRVSSLAQVLVKATAPGVPDFYQGSELWLSTLADPDNRDDVDFALRAKLLSAATSKQYPMATPLFDDDQGLAKLAAIRTALAVRRDEPTAFLGDSATYLPIELHGEHAEAGMAFARGGRVVTVVPIRPLAIVRHGWGETTLDLPAGDWINVLDSGRRCTGRTSMAEITGSLRSALLVKAS